MRKRRGMTAVELLIVLVVILTIVGSLAIGGLLVYKGVQVADTYIESNQ